METQAPFGIVTGCHAGDRNLVQATLASIRHYMGDVPICLIQDGNFPIADLRDLYDLTILRPQDTSDPVMRDLITGNFRAKLLAMWEGPFERFVWLDSDAIVWGDFRSSLDQTSDFQIFWSEVSVPPDATDIPEWLPHYYFHPNRLARFDPTFEWRGLPYFCSGAFLSKRNAIPFDIWIEVEDWLKTDPDLFAWGEMGILNYIVHSLSQKNQISVLMTNLQDLWIYHGREELAQDCLGRGWKLPERINRPRVAHFCGRKPNIFDRKSYSKPFTIARIAHYERMGHPKISSFLKIALEDFSFYARKLLRRLKLKR